MSLCFFMFLGGGCIFVCDGERCETENLLSAKLVNLANRYVLLITFFMSRKNPNSKSFVSMYI